MNKNRKNIRDISFMSKKNGKVIMVHSVIAREVARLLENDDRVEHYDTDVPLEKVAEKIDTTGLRDAYLTIGWKTDFAIHLADERVVIIEVETRENLQKKVKPVYVWSISAIIILIVRVALYCLKINDAWEIIASVVETLNLVSIIILTQKTADIEEKQYCLQASKSANVIARMNANDFEEALLDHAQKFAIKLDIYNKGNDVATDIEIVVNEQKFVTIEFIAPSETKQILLGIVDYENNSIELLTGEKIALDKTNKARVIYHKVECRSGHWFLAVKIGTPLTITPK